MKKVMMLFLLAAVVFIVGCGDSSGEVMEDKDMVKEEVMEEKEEVMEDKEGDVMEEKEVSFDLTKPNALINKNKYLTGGRDTFDTAKVFFTQNSGTGYDIDVSANGAQIEVEVMDDFNCLKKDDEEEYVTLDVSQGTDVKIVSSQVAEEKRNICIAIKAIDEGEVTVLVVVNEVLPN
ncbi:MAG: hypothetical protein CMH62_03495 [Nanoarchaeota archaeon]|nr:hypothetical protein [Nanoarchaeota archaeon]|tara:strand:- start:1471 stop:2001 length:531 start_codon:yes stop_codon:yes gene_type:complete